MFYKEYVTQSGKGVGMSSAFIHQVPCQHRHDKDIFSNAAQMFKGFIFGSDEEIIDAAREFGAVQDVDGVEMLLITISGAPQVRMPTTEGLADRIRAVSQDVRIP